MSDAHGAASVQEVHPTVVVTAGDRRFELTPDATFTFGRAQSCTVCLDPTDVGISRTAGSVEYADGTWWLHNRSTRRPFVIVNRRGLRQVAVPGERHPVDGCLRIVVDGSDGKHHLELLGPHSADDQTVTQTGPSTAFGQTVSLNDKDRLALVALFAGYLRDGERYDPWPRSYDAVAAQLGWSRTALVHRVDFIRRRLTKAGVPNLHGQRALELLAEHVLATGMISKTDLHLMGE
jgi:hypothetical protein